MSVAVALSQHPLAADAAGEVVGTVIETMGLAPDLAITFASGSHRGFLGETEATVRTLLAPRLSVACATGGVIGGRQEAEEGSALALFAAWLPPGSTVGTVEPMPHGDGDDAFHGPSAMVEDAHLLVLGDPARFAPEPFLDGLARHRPDVAVVGGLRSGGDAVPGTAVLIADGVACRGGAIGVLLPPEPTVRAAVSQGCRPVGAPMVVTQAERSYLHGLAGRPALTRLNELIESASPEDRTLLAGGVELGVVVDERRDDFGRGDFVIRSVLGADRSKGVLAVGAEIPVGTTVQFQVRDAASASQDLLDTLADSHGTGALVFSCAGRGRGLFGRADHDADTVADVLDTGAIAGMFCAGELGPVAGRSFLHTLSAAIAVFADG